MARKFLTNLDLAYFAVQNALMFPVSSDPTGLTSAQKGLVWFNTTTNKLMVYNGTTGIDLLARANHSGTQTASTISDLATVVKAYRLDEFAVPTTTVAFGSQRIINVADPSGAQDGATKNYVDNAIAGLSSGLVMKGAVKAASTTNVNIAAPGATVDGVTGATNDVFLLTGQTTGSQNGPYVFTGSGTAMTRATNWDTSGEAVLGSFWVVQQGTQADTFAILTNDTAITLGTTTPAFVFRGAAGSSYTAGNGMSLSGSVFNANPGTGISIPASAGSNISIDTTIVGRKVTGTIPASSAGVFSVSGATVTINHALANAAARLEATYGSSPPAGGTAGYPCELEYYNSDTNNTVVTLPAAPGANQYNIAILG